VPIPDVDQLPLQRGDQPHQVPKLEPRGMELKVHRRGELNPIDQYVIDGM
jgi:hypothetical protein